MLVFIVPTVIGCGAGGGVSVMLKSPIEERCNKAGIQGCPEVVEGAIVYIGGDKPKGKDQMLRGAAQNAPEKVKEFAKAIKELPLDKIPGATKYTSVIIEVADILAGAQPAAPPPGPATPPPPAGAPKIMVNGLTLEGAQLAGIPDIEFDTGQATIKGTPSNNSTLGLLVVGAKANPHITKLRVEGHTDSDGDAASNQVLSEKRAAAVVEWLVNHGVEPQRLRAVGCGSRDPLFPNDSAEHKARNRRTEFDIETINNQRPDGYTEACAPNSFRAAVR
jgi:outer membrane protein OmpA-like peptidoglycan-associated protein